jgi:hypothetical protein
MVIRLAVSLANFYSVILSPLFFWAKDLLFVLGIQKKQVLVRNLYVSDPLALPERPVVLGKRALSCGQKSGHRFCVQDDNESKTSLDLRNSRKHHNL